jgi:hypothetical protein
VPGKKHVQGITDRRPKGEPEPPHPPGVVADIGMGMGRMKMEAYGKPAAGIEVEKNLILLQG